MNESLTHATQQVLAGFEAAKAKISEISEKCRNIVVNNGESLAIAKDYAITARQIEKLIEDKRKEVTKPLVDEKKRIDDFAKTLTLELNNNVKALRSQILSYEQELERIRLAELKRLEDERRAKEEELKKQVEEQLKQAQESEEDLPDAVMEDLSARADELKELNDKAAEASIPTSTSIRKVWDFEVTDIAKIPAEYLEVNNVAVRKAITAGARDIPGIRIFQKEQLNLR